MWLFVKDGSLFLFRIRMQFLVSKFAAYLISQLFYLYGHYIWENPVSRFKVQLLHGPDVVKGLESSWWFLISNPKLVMSQKKWMK